VNVSIRDLEGTGAPAVLAALRSAAPVSWVEALGGWLVTGYPQAATVMRDPVSFTVDDPRFSTARVVGASMLSLDGAEHRRHRGPFVAPFRPGRVERDFGREVEDLVVDLVDRIRPRGRADLRTELAGPLAVAVVTGMLGLRAVEAATVLDWYAAIVEAVSAISAGRAPDPAAAVAVGLLSGHVRAGLTQPAPSVLKAAATSLSEGEIVSNAAVVMFGGIDTTEGAIANVIMHVLHHGDVRDAIVADPALIPAAVEESLRLEPAAAVVDRYATREISFGGATVRAGDLVRVSISGANRDPAVFPDPDVFDLRRPNGRVHLSFARGPHVCVAQDLARLEGRVVLRTLLDRLPGLRLDGTVAARGLVFRKPPALPVAWEGRA
jgi:cytochrome P450